MTAKPTPIFHAAVAVARSCKAMAKELDEAFLKHTDPRAVQGGAVCDEADAWRELAHQAYRLAGRIEDAED